MAATAATYCPKLLPLLLPSSHVPNRQLYLKIYAYEDGGVHWEVRLLLRAAFPFAHAKLPCKMLQEQKPLWQSAFADLGFVFEDEFRRSAQAARGDSEGGRATLDAKRGRRQR